MADRMPSEILDKFKAAREEKKAPSGEELRPDARKRALAKARKSKEMRGNKGWAHTAEI